MTEDIIILDGLKKLNSKNFSFGLVGKVIKSVSVEIHVKKEQFYQQSGEYSYVYDIYIDQKLLFRDRNSSIGRHPYEIFEESMLIDIYLQYLNQ